MQEMQRDQAPAGGIADAVGLSWLLEDIGDVRIVAHGGTTHGQLSAFAMVPEHDFAVTVLTNSTRGIEVYNPVVKKALEQFVGVTRAAPVPSAQNGTAPYDRYEGRFVDGFKTFAVDLKVQGRGLKGSFEALGPDSEDPGLPPFRLELYDEDRVVIKGGRLDGFKADFVRDGRGRVRWFRLGGRLLRRTPLPR